MCLAPSSPRSDICLSKREKYSFLNLTLTTPSVVNKDTVPLSLFFAIQVPQILNNLNILTSLLPL